MIVAVRRFYPRPFPRWRNFVTAATSDRTLDERAAKSRLIDLNGIINRYDDSYYNDSVSQVTDAAYDALVQEASSLEATFPKLKGIVQKLSTVGTNPSLLFSEFKHSEPMLSLQNAFSREDLSSFVARVSGEQAAYEQVDFVVEPKIDGVSLALIFENGILVRAGSRGNGLTGEDITRNVLLYVSDIPKVLPMIESLPITEIRGEVYMSRDQFLKLNSSGSDTLISNPRNAASGMLRRKYVGDAHEPSDNVKPLRFFAYYLSFERDNLKSNLNFKLHSEEIKLLNELGFKTASLWDSGAALPEHIKAVAMSSVDAIHSACLFLETLRHNWPYDIDGAVVKVNDIDLQKQIGANSKYPKWAMAYKFRANQNSTKLIKIDVQVGRTGKLTPVAILEPVKIGGVTIQRATLHNEDEADRLLRGALGDAEFDDTDIGALDITALICRSGDVIPKILSMTCSNPDVFNRKRQADLFDRANRDGNETSTITRLYNLPKSCPSCGSPTQRANDESGVFCSSDQFSCPAQKTEMIRHFCSKDAMNISGLGIETISSLVEFKILESPIDIFKLDVAFSAINQWLQSKKKNQKTQTTTARVKDGLGDDIISIGNRNISLCDLNLKGWGEKSMKKLTDSINKCKQISDERFLYALGIQHVGITASALVTSHFGGFHRFWRFGLEELDKQRNLFPSDEGIPMSSKFFDALANIPRLSENAIESLWQLFSNTKQKELAEQLLCEISLTSSQEYMDQAKKAPLVKKKLKSILVEDLGFEKLREQIMGKTVVFTGTLSSEDPSGNKTVFSRSSLMDLISKLGGVNGKSVTAKTDILICGIQKSTSKNSRTSSSEKIKKATAKNVQIWIDGEDSRIEELKRLASTTS